MSDVSPQFSDFTGAVSWRVWAGSRVAALGLAGVLIVALLSMKPPEQPPERAPILAVKLAVTLRDLPPIIVSPQFPTVLPASSPPAVTSDAAQSKSLRARPQSQRLKQGVTPPIRPLPDRPIPQTTAPKASPASPANATPVSAIPRIASVPVGQGPASAGAQAPSGNGTLPRRNGLSTTGTGTTHAGTLTLLRARECARLDIGDRPADCPTNAELLRLLAAQRSPQYRPENADGFSSNEQRWRGIPPPCLADGVNASISGTSACIRVGNVPSRVRTVREICEARGLGGCADAPSQAAINAAIAQVKQQEAAKGSR